MGIIQSILCSISFCVERILTWVCCAYLLIMMLFTFVLLVIYGITVGYHYAQKELVSFAYNSRVHYDRSGRRVGGSEVAPISPMVLSDFVRYTFRPRSFEDVNSSVDLDMYSAKPTSSAYAEMFWDTREPTETPSIEESDSFMPPMDLSPHEKELARRLLGRVRRSRDNITSKNIFLRRTIRKYG